MTENGKYPVIPNMNGLRTFGAIAVVVFHAHYLNRGIWGDFFHSAFFEKAEIVINRGYFAIELFFIISGFLITHLLLHEQYLTGNISVKNFLARRFLRIWPLYFLVVIFGFFVFPHLPYGVNTVHQFWLFALFLSNYSEIAYGARDSLNFLSATWTVSVEEQFYICWAVIFGVFRFRSIRIYLALFIALIAGSLVFRWMNLDNQRMLDLHLFSVMSDLALGGLCALIAFTGLAGKWFGALSRTSIIIIYIAGICLLVLDDHIFKGGMVVFGRLIPGIFLSFIVLEQAFAKRSFFKSDRIPGFYFIGKHTYAIYLFHCIIIYYVGIAFDTFGLTESWYYYILYLVVILLATWFPARLSFLYFEKPFLNLRRFFRS